MRKGCLRVPWNDSAQACADRGAAFGWLSSDTAPGMAEGRVSPSDAHVATMPPVRDKANDKAAVQASDQAGSARLTASSGSVAHISGAKERTTSMCPAATAARGDATSIRPRL